MTQLSTRSKVLFSLLLVAVFAGMAKCQSNEYMGGKLAWFEDFRTSLTDKGLVWVLESNAQINRVAKGSATGTWPSQLTHVAQNVYYPEQGAFYAAIDLWPAPAVGQYLFMRMLVSNALPNGADTEGDHGNQTNLIGPLSWFWRIWGGDADSFLLESTTWDDNQTGSLRQLQVDAPKNTVLRLEWRVQRTGAISAVYVARVYNNQTGALLGESVALPNSAAPGAGADHFRNYFFGMAGQYQATYTGGSVYWGAVAARVSSNANDWIGPYPVAGVER